MASLSLGSGVYYTFLESHSKKKQLSQGSTRIICTVWFRSQVNSLKLADSLIFCMISHFCIHQNISLFPTPLEYFHFPPTLTALADSLSWSTWVCHNTAKSLNLPGADFPPKIPHLMEGVKKTLTFDFGLWLYMTYNEFYPKKNFSTTDPPLPPSLWLTIKNLGFVKISYPDLINIH